MNSKVASLLGVPVESSTTNSLFSIRKSGFLLKKPTNVLNKQWNKRWVLIQGGFLIWYKQPTFIDKRIVFSTKVHGFIPLQGYQVIPAGKDGVHYVLELTHSSMEGRNSNLTFKTEDHKEAEEWMAAINQHASCDWSGLNIRNIFKAEDLVIVENQVAQLLNNVENVEKATEKLDEERIDVMELSMKRRKVYPKVMKRIEKDVKLTKTNEILLEKKIRKLHVARTGVECTKEYLQQRKTTLRNSALKLKTQCRQYRKAHPATKVQKHMFEHINKLEQIVSNLE